MHGLDDFKGSPAAGGDPNLPWYKELTRYHWYVLIVAALGWLFDTMDQQLFVLARTPALTELLNRGLPAGQTVAPADITRYAGYATTIFIVGWATGGLLFGMLGDKIGRARTMLLTILIYSLFTGLSAFSVTFWDFSFYRFVTGMGVGGEFAAGVTLVAEVMPARARPYAIGLLQALSAVGNMMAAGISFLIPPQMETQGVAGWRLMFLIGIVPSLLVVFVRKRLKEPDSWVQAQADRVTEASAKTVPAADGAPAQYARVSDADKQLGDIKELFRDPRWRHHTFIGVTLAAAGVMGLWGVGFWTPELVRNNVLKDLPKPDQDWYASMSSLLMNFGAFFGIYAFALIAGVTGRRPAFALSFILALTSTVAVFGFMTEKSQIWWMIPMLGFCSLMVFGGYAIYFPELFPTRLRSTGTGFCYNVARYFAALAPFLLGHLAGMFAAAKGTPRGDAGLSDLTFLSSWGSVDSPFRYACITVALVFVIGLLVLPFAPETKGKPLPE